MGHREKQNKLSAAIRINITEEYEVRHWARQLNLSPAALRAAVGEVGPLVEAIRQYVETQAASTKS